MYSPFTKIKYIPPFPHMGFPVAQLVKNPPAMRETWVWSLGWEDPLEKGKATHSSILAWRIPRTIQSMGSQRVGHDWVTFTPLHFTSSTSPATSLEQFLKAIWCAVSQSAVLILPQINLNSQLSRCAFKFDSFIPWKSAQVTFCMRPEGRSKAAAKFFEPGKTLLQPIFAYVLAHLVGMGQQSGLQLLWLLLNFLFHVLWLLVQVHV